MKGIGPPEIIAIIIAVAFAAVLLYLGFTKGLGPFSSSTNEAQCRTNILKACQDANQWSKVSTTCVSYITDSNMQTNFNNCKTNGPGSDCDAFCTAYLAT